jgi:uncharacterized protein
MSRLEQSFTVNAPLEEVWAALVDVERVAPCLPGAEVLGQEGPGKYRGAFNVRLGPTTASYTGVLEMVEVDEAAHKAAMSAKGQDKRGQGSASATIVNTVVDEGGTTRVDVVTDFTITGRLARFGRSGMIEDISKRLLRDFAQNLEASLQQQPAAEPAPAPDADPAVAAAAIAPDAGAAAAAVTIPATARPPASPPPRKVEAAKPVSGFRLVLDVLLERLKRLFGRG